ncbi:TetR/AcrR family transcriptional regulator [Fodinicola feengrottensis]
MSHSTHEGAAPAGRPRDPALERAILEAAVDVLMAQGLAKATVEEVARQAGTGKAAIYRRWPSKTALVIAAIRALHADVSVPDTGSLREDLVTCALHYSSGDERSTLLLASLLGAATHEPELRKAAYESIGRPPALALRSVLDRWIERGEIDPDAPVDIIAGVLPSYAFRQMVARREKLDEATIAALIDHVLLPALRHRRG